LNLTQSQKFLRKFGLRIAKYYSTSTTYETFNTYEHFLFISKLIARTNGAFVECGFGTGKSFSALSHLAQRSEREIYGFDTFEGFPEPDPNDASSRNSKKGQWKVRTLNEAKRQVNSLGISDLKFELIKGPVEISVPAFAERKIKIALLHIDLDLYSGYQTVLQNLYPLLASKGVICLDDYGQTKWPGCQKAVDEFLLLNLSLKLIKSEFGKYYIVND
jgi:ubiquinone/menaquinone biosynthesis C-methylase UbiE